MPEDKPSTFYRTVLRPALGEEYKSEQQERRHEDDAAFVERFRAQREAFEEFQKERRKDAAEKRREDALARNRPLPELSEFYDYEVGPAKAIQARDALGFRADTIEFIEDRYPTLDKWLGLGKRGSILSHLEHGKKVSASSKFHRRLEQLPEKLKAALGAARTSIRDELTGPLPLNFHKGSAELGLSWITDPEARPEKKREGWKMLTKELRSAAKAIPDEMRTAKREAMGAMDYPFYSDEIKLFGVLDEDNLRKEAGLRDATRGLADEARHDYRMKQHIDKKSPYFAEET